MRYWSEGHMDDGWGLTMVVVMVGVGLMIALAVGLAILWTSRTASAPPQPTAEPSAGPGPHGNLAEAEQILARRMASGETDNEEFRTRLEALRTAAP